MTYGPTWHWFFVYVLRIFLLPFHVLQRPTKKKPYRCSYCMRPTAGGPEAGFKKPVCASRGCLWAAGEDV